MTRRRPVAFVVIAAVVAGTVAHFASPGGAASALCFLAAGLVLGELERRFNGAEGEAPEPYMHYASSNGHGSLEHAVGITNGS